MQKQLTHLEESGETTQRLQDMVSQFTALVNQRPTELQMAEHARVSMTGNQRVEQIQEQKIAIQDIIIRAQSAL
jgi:hypothetical protein